MTLDTILVALILLVEIIDVLRHWNSHETILQVVDPDCSRCLDRLARSLRRNVGVANQYAYKEHTPPDAHAVTGEDGAYDYDSGLNPNDAARTARAFLSNPHRHVSQPVKYSRDSMRHDGHGAIHSNLSRAKQ